MNRTDLRIPANLTMPELADFLRGAGYEETFVLVHPRGTHHTFTNVGPADGTPDIIGVIEASDGITIIPVDEGTDDDPADHEWRTCGCHVCVEDRAEFAALRRVGM